MHNLTHNKIKTAKETQKRVDPEKILQAIKQSGFTQTELGAVINRTRNQINQIVKGKRKVTGDELLSISAALDTNPEMFAHD